MMFLLHMFNHHRQQRKLKSNMRFLYLHFHVRIIPYAPTLLSLFSCFKPNWFNWKKVALHFPISTLYVGKRGAMMLPERYYLTELKTKIKCTLSILSIILLLSLYVCVFVCKWFWLLWTMPWKLKFQIKNSGNRWHPQI